PPSTKGILDRFFHPRPSSKLSYSFSSCLASFSTFGTAFTLFVTSCFALLICASVTFTVIVTVSFVVLPRESVTEYVTSVLPTLLVSTLPSTTILSVTSPSSLSCAVTPSNRSKSDSKSTVLSATPLNTGAWFSLTVTVRLTTCEAPPLSVTIYVMVCFPASSVLIVPRTSILSVKSPSSLSSAVIPSNASKSDAKSILISSTPEILGA